jgi:predicted nuclease of restriction endonuclease-like (RecB) superfamily
MNKNQIINIVPHSYHSVLSDIIQKVNMARYLMIKTVNTETVQLYWQIGKIVSEKINIEKWGNSVVEKLSKDLQTEFPGVKGFSVRNIRYMKSFYETYKENLKLQPLVAEIG